MKTYSVSVSINASMTLYIDAENESDAADTILEQVKSNPHYFTSEYDLNPDVKVDKVNEVK